MPQSTQGALVSPSPLRYFADLADSRLPAGGGGTAAAAAQQLPERVSSLHDALAAQRDQV